VKQQQVPFVDLKRNHDAISEEINGAIKGVLDRGLYILGEEVRAFEAEFARYIGSRHGVGVSSGTAALTIALEALGVGEGDEVITAANTAFPTVTAIFRARAVPVLVDAREDDYNLDVRKLEEAVSDRTKAVVPVHLYGYPCDIKSILDFASATGIKVVEDCAQAHGATINGKKVGSFGDAGCFSFYPTKNLGAYGDGGIIVTDLDEIAVSSKRIRHHGQSEKDEHEVVGMCARLDEVQGAVLRVKLKHLDELNKRRREIASMYVEGLKAVIIPRMAEERKNVYHLFVIRTESRDRLRYELSQKGIGTGIHYPKPIHLQKAFFWPGMKRGDFPISEKLSREILSLPVFPELTNAEASIVIEAVNEALGSQ
jgi:dTDP-4-amino-4,6-dideoxygalactose transaminase